MNSSLVSYVNRGIGQYSRRTKYISKICIHDALTAGDCDTLSDIIASAPYSSFHYGIATNGDIGVYVDEQYRAWGTGNPDVDQECVHIVVCNSSASGDYPISSATQEALLKLVTDICRRNFILKLTYTGKARESNLIKHSWYSGTACPRGYLSSLYPRIVQEVNKRLSTPQLANSQSEAYKSQTNIVVDAIDPFVVTVSPTATNVNYRNLILTGVVGAMFYAGGLYQSGILHLEKDRYVSPTLKRQMQELGDAMPFALYCDVRARNIEEARKECDALFYVISKYPPKLGIWLGLDLGVNKTTNNNIIDVYYRWIVEWGLKDKCGFYCNKTQLGRISWDAYCRQFALWLINPLSSVSNLYDLETPNFFKV